VASFLNNYFQDASKRLNRTKLCDFQWPLKFYFVMNQYLYKVHSSQIGDREFQLKEKNQF